MAAGSNKRSREHPLQVRVSGEELRVFKLAAAAAGLTVSGWTRDRLRQAAHREARRIPSLPRLTKRDQAPIHPR